MSRMFKLNTLFLTILLGMSAVVVVGCAELDTTQTQIMPTQINEQPLVQNSVESPTTPAPARPLVVNDKHVTLTNLSLNNQGNQITIKPGKSIQATLNYAYNCPNCKASLGNQIIIGLANRSAQACIYNGGSQGQGSANFELKVPAKPGRYDVRFRGLQTEDCTAALEAGWSADDSPSKETTIGTITVSRRAEA